MGLFPPLFFCYMGPLLHATHIVVSRQAEVANKQNPHTFFPFLTNIKWSRKSRKNATKCLSDNTAFLPLAGAKGHKMLNNPKFLQEYRIHISQNWWFMLFHSATKTTFNVYFQPLFSGHWYEEVWRVLNLLLSIAMTLLCGLHFVNSWLIEYEHENI